MEAARVLLLPIVDWVRPMHHITVDGRFSAIVRATRSTWLAATPVTRSVSSGVHFATSARIWSMPQTRWRMNSLSSQPFSKMCQRTPHMKATSDPGRSRTYSWA